MVDEGYELLVHLPGHPVQLTLRARDEAVHGDLHLKLELSHDSSVADSPFGRDPEILSRFGGAARSFSRRLADETPCRRALSCAARGSRPARASSGRSRPRKPAPKEGARPTAVSSACRCARPA